MKNNRLFTLLALLLMAGGVKTQAQEYVPMIQEGNEWYTLDAIVCKDTEGHYQCGRFFGLWLWRLFRS